MAIALQVRYPDAKVICADFLSCKEELGLFDKIIINPPFANGQDIAHIKHALTLLRPGARLVAICANGPKQQASLGALVSHHGGTWEELPGGTFAESGTGVRTVMITIEG
ncbi:hypothetical protein ACQUFY_25750 (plasmid) [Robbsia andropogonis]|uniref:hypothetical protein n=1 Tax=Robbsia andropogonis TaxID=28092 RepID=UPI003D1D9C0E